MGAPEFQAVIMAAGKGSRMTELTARKPKCLLPVGNLPMLWFPINLLERAGFQEVIVVIQETFKSETLAALDRCDVRIKVELFGIPALEDLGTADSLRMLQETNKIKSDVVVLSCDLVTDVNLAPLLDLYRKHDAAIAALLVETSQTPPTLPVPGPKTKHKPERDLIGVNKKTSRLVFVASASDFEESVPLSRKLLSKAGHVILHSRLLDTHLYVLRHWLVQYLAQYKSLSTLKGEVLPFVVKKHMAHSAKQKVETDKASVIEADIKTDLTQFGQESDLTHKIRAMSTYTDERCRAVYSGDTIRCYAQRLTEAECYALRANTLAQYARVNREILEKWGRVTGGRDLVRVAPSAEVKSTQFETETCLVAERAVISEKTSVKSSIIGQGALISPRTRVVNSVLMSGVTIGQGCSIQNCIICEESVIEDNCDLKDCLVGSHYTVPSGGKHVNEVLTDIEGLMEI